jgi:hypothetical protein
MFMLVFGFVMRSRTALYKGRGSETSAKLRGSHDETGVAPKTSWAFMRALVPKNVKRISKKEKSKKKCKMNAAKTDIVRSKVPSSLRFWIFSLCAAESVGSSEIRSKAHA